MLRRFQSVPWAVAEFSNPTFLVGLVGRNGSGKSNLADTFAFLAEAMASLLQAVFDLGHGICRLAAVAHRTLPPPPVFLDGASGRAERR